MSEDDKDEILIALERLEDKFERLEDKVDKIDLLLELLEKVKNYMDTKNYNINLLLIKASKWQSISNNSKN